MHPHQPYPSHGGSNPPYANNPQQSSYNAIGAQAQQQAPPYSITSGLFGGQHSNMSAPQGSNPYGSNTGNPYGQNTGTPYGPASGNPYAQGGPGSGPSGQPFSGQQSYGSNPNAANNPPGGMQYPPPQGGGYPPQTRGYQPQGGGYPPQAGGYQPQGGGFPPQAGGYQPQGGGYPPQAGGYQPQGGGYPPQAGGYQPQGGGYGPQAGASQPQGGGYGPQAGASQPQGGGLTPNDPRIQQINQLAQRYEISPQIVARLQQLASCEIVLLCDDSGSMKTQLKGTNQTRWDELKYIVNTVVEIGTIMDSNGIDVYFLNRSPILNATNPQTIRQAFSAPPSGLTPLVPALRKIFADKRSLSYGKKLLILVATDGAPTNNSGQIDIGTLESVLRNERAPQTYITFLACTDDLAAVNYLADWDKSMHNLDVVDDYESEREEIRRVRGQNFPFSRGDYIAKALLGSLDPWFDSFDERA